MTTAARATVDLVVSVLAAAAWLGAGVSAASHRRRLALGLSAVALVASAGRVGTVALLAGSGWWFVQEKVALALPLLAIGAVAAVVVAGGELLAGRRSAPAADSRGGPGAAADTRGGAGGPGAGAVLALLVAGYCAAAGPAVTLLSGYPSGWSAGLIAVALVVAAATATARVLGLHRLRAPAVAALTAAVVAGGLALIAPSTVDVGGGAAVAGTGRATPVSELLGPTAPAPGGTVRRFTLTARTATITLRSGRPVSAWTFDSRVPGPPIAVTQGDLVEVTLHNADIADGVTLHWHGYDVPAAEDGVPGLTQDAVGPGQEYVYRFRADQVGTYWYHTHEVSDRGVKLGLYGTLVVTPRAAAAPGIDLTLPVHTLGGSLVFGESDQASSREVAPGTAVRLRLINTDDEPRVVAVTGTAFRVVSVDGTDLNAPGEVSGVGLRIPAGGRFDVALTMPAGRVAVRPAHTGDVALILTNGGAGEGPDPRAWPVLDLLAYGQPAATPFDGRSTFDRRFTLVLDRGAALVDGTPAYAYTVNGRAYPGIATEYVRAGDLVEFTVVNRGGVVHPWHLHGHRVLVLSRNGSPPTGSPLWLDTFDVRPGEVWRVAFRADNPGLWMNHCHNLGHADQGMALHLAYEGVVSSFHGGHGG